MRFLIRDSVNPESEGPLDHLIPCLAPHHVFTSGGIHCFPWETTAQLKVTSPNTSSQFHPLLLGALPWMTRTYFSKECITSKCLWTPSSPHYYDHFINLLSISSSRYSLKTWNLSYCSSPKFPFFFGKLWSRHALTSIPVSSWITVNPIPLSLLM